MPSLQSLPDVTSGAIPAADLAAALYEASWGKVASDVILSGLLAPSQAVRTRQDAHARSVLHWLIARLAVAEAALDDMGRLGAGPALAKANHAAVGISGYLDELILLHPATGECPVCKVVHCQTSKLVARARALADHA